MDGCLHLFDAKVFERGRWRERFLPLHLLFFCLSLSLFFSKSLYSFFFPFLVSASHRFLFHIYSKNIIRFVIQYFIQSSRVLFRYHFTTLSLISLYTGMNKKKYIYINTD